MCPVLTDSKPLVTEAISRWVGTRMEPPCLRWPLWGQDQPLIFLAGPDLCLLLSTGHLCAALARLPLLWTHGPVMDLT